MQVEILSSFDSRLFYVLLCGYLLHVVATKDSIFPTSTPFSSFESLTLFADFCALQIKIE